MRLRPLRTRRSGVTAAESIITTTALMMLLVGTVDLSTGLFRQQVICEAARMGARAAIVHGNTPASSMTQWGPTTYGPVTANTNDAKAQAVASFLPGLDPSTVNVTYSWPDSSSAPEKRVQVTVTTTWTPIMGWIFGTSSYTISASSEMPIAH